MIKLTNEKADKATIIMNKFNIHLSIIDGKTVN